MSAQADNYRQLIDQFLQREITVSQFESAFLDRFKSEPEGMPEGLFKPLDRLFGDVDIFCADDDLRDDDELDEQGLRQACERTLLEIAGL